MPAKTPDMISLRLFSLVCATGNISQAAHRAHLVPSALSKRITQLESDLGVQLLERKRQGVTPTAAGLTLLEHVNNVQIILERIKHDMGAYSAGLRGQVRMLACASVLSESLPEDIANFLRMPEYQAIQFDIEERNSSGVVDGVLHGDAAIGICWDGTDLKDLTVHPYRTDHLAAVVPRGHPLALRGRVEFKETLDYQHVGLPLNSTVKTYLQRSASDAGKKFLFRVMVSGFDAALRVVRSKLAIGILPLEVAEAYQFRSDIHVIPLTNPWAHRQFVICHRGSTQQLPLLEQLVVEQFSGMENRSKPGKTGSGRHVASQNPVT